MRNLIAYLPTAAIFLGLDLIWLALIAKPFYRSQLQPLLAERFYAPAAAIFYLLYPVGLCIFVVWPALRSGGAARAMLDGAMFGFFAYMTYDLSNLATLRGWPIKLTIIDIGWGTLVSGAAAAAGVYLARLLG